MYLYILVVLHGTVRGWSWVHMEVFGRFERGWGGIGRSWRYVVELLKVPRQVFGRFWRYQWDANSLLGIPFELLDIQISIHYRSLHLYSSDGLLCDSLKSISKPTWLEFKINLQNQTVSTEKGAPFADHLAGTRTLSNNRQVRWPSSWHDKQSMIHSSMNLQLHYTATHHRYKKYQKVVG